MKNRHGSRWVKCMRACVGRSQDEVVSEESRTLFADDGRRLHPILKGV
jgi:hypothetical protein